MVKVVVFDVDGTLVDSVDCHARAWVDAFQDFGHAVAFDDVRRQIGKGGDQLLPVFLSDEQIDAEGDKLEKHRGDILKERYLSLIVAFPEVRSLLERLHEQGTRVALASSAKKDELQTYKEIAGIVDLVDLETSSDDAGSSKPHPDIFEAVLKRLPPEIELKDVIAVGDTPYDAQAAGKAGLRTIGLRCGGWAERDLLESGCIATYRDPAELLAGFDASALAAARN